GCAANVDQEGFRAAGQASKRDVMKSSSGAAGGCFLCEPQGPPARHAGVLAPSNNFASLRNIVWEEVGRHFKTGHRYLIPGTSRLISKTE
ncbi:MAG: hypothetical protein WAL71_14625, partial [Terriglobales bacterium]